MSLSIYLSNHGVVAYVANNTQEIQYWLDSIPDTINGFELLLYAIPINELSNLFKNRDVPKWFSELCTKVHNNTDIEVFLLGANTTDRKKQTKRFLGLFVKELVKMGLFELDMQSLINYLLSWSVSGLNMLLILFVADGLLTEGTLLNLQVELSGVKRWQALGLSSLPTLEEIEQALS
jgi:hypothetical protein